MTATALAAPVRVGPLSSTNTGGIIMQDSIIFNGKWEARERLVVDLPGDLQYKLATHRRNVAAATPLLEEFGFRLDIETQICRGQPETGWVSMDGGSFRVWLLGYEHWGVHYHGGARIGGTRNTASLRKTLERLLPQEG